MDRTANGTFVELDGERFYKIENYDRMEDFFMTITSASDVWNFCWAQGGLSAGRMDANHAVFPYYTADKLSDMKSVTGPCTIIAVHGKDGTPALWEPFAPLLCTGTARYAENSPLTRSIYKNQNGTKVWFEEVNDALRLSFRYGWTSSGRFGLVRMVRLENLSDVPQSISVLDGCRNIMCASCTSEFQNGNSVLLDAYKQTDLDEESSLALFSVSSVVTDKAEPSEGLYANAGWFSGSGATFIQPDAPRQFVCSGGKDSAIHRIPMLKGKRPVLYTARSMNLAPGAHSGWYQVFDTALTASDVESLRRTLADKDRAEQELEEDIRKGNEQLTAWISSADGVQDTARTMTCVHHRENVMFNIMRGGVFAEGGDVNRQDFLSFIECRNRTLKEDAADVLSSLPHTRTIPLEAAREAFSRRGNAQLERLFLEYLPLTFSRRHGDPSRPWNKFSIKLKDGEGNPMLNYEGNWRDIFQNWEALAFSYPAYLSHFVAKFLNAMTCDGFNPYHISREGVNWETPDPENPWAQFGYWGDHQVIYLQKLLELFDAADPEGLRSMLDRTLFTSANVPYRLKSYDEMAEDPRNSLSFDAGLSQRLIEESAVHGSDRKLVQGKDGQPALTSFTSKIIQIVITKATNLVPGGGIWMNTQRPEWNDANNALAGWGLSVVTVAYLYRMLTFLIALYEESRAKTFTVPGAQASAFIAVEQLYGEFDAQDTVQDKKLRKRFTERAGRIFEEERNELYAGGFGERTADIEANRIVRTLTLIRDMAEATLRKNKRSDGLYHSYNTLRIKADGMEVSPLQEMLEGQVAILSSGLLSGEEALSVVGALRQSRMYEPHQNSYMLYPDKELPPFTLKNRIQKPDMEGLAQMARRSKGLILSEDCGGTWHFNADFTNARIMREKISSLPEEQKPTEEELSALFGLYERTFNHSSFTGRSGTFYAYEGLGSIYWHMVSKLLFAIQENVLRAEKEAPDFVQELTAAYYSVREGLGFNKEPSLYGAFPADPYSHTPWHQGAKQPGMTGQVKEEVLTRWGELGVRMKDGMATFNPTFLKKEEFHADGTLGFSWCGTPVVYHLSGAEDRIELSMKDGSTVRMEGNIIPRNLSESLFQRKGTIARIDAWISLSAHNLQDNS